MMKRLISQIVTHERQVYRGRFDEAKRRTEQVKRLKHLKS